MIELIAISYGYAIHYYVVEDFIEECEPLPELEKIVMMGSMSRHSDTEEIRRHSECDDYNYFITPFENCWEDKIPPKKILPKYSHPQFATMHRKMMFSLSGCKGIALIKREDNYYRRKNS